MANIKRTLFSRLALILSLFLIAGPVVQESLAQSSGKTFSVSFKDKSLAVILDYISQHSDHRVTYGDEVRKYDGKVTVSMDQVTAERAVQVILSKSPFTYSVNGKTIKVYRLQAAQTGEYVVQGVVKEQNGTTIPSATVQIKAEKKGQLSDLDGKFSIKVSNPNGEVTVSCVGFTAKTVKYKAGTPLTIVLKEDVNVLGEVSVIAYGSRNTRELTGAIASVKSEQIQDMPTPSIETLLQGQMPGIEVTNLSGTPGGGGSQVTIRGFSSLNQQGINDGSPLYVVDGVPVMSSTGKETGGVNPLASLDPTTIESVEVLKDAASASLYGSRAGNGVILITTKKGKSGKAQFSVNFSHSLSWLPETPVQMMGHAERIWHTKVARSQRAAYYDWMTDRLVIPTKHEDSYGWDPEYDGAYDYFWRNGARIEEGRRVPAIVTDSLNSFYNNKSNWWKYMFRLGHVTDLDVNASGGTDNVRYVVGAGMYDETGIMLGSSFKRFSFMNNLDINLTPKLELYTRLSLSYTDKNAGSDMGKVQGLTIDPKMSSTLFPGRGTDVERETLRSLQDILMRNKSYNIRLIAGLKYQLLKGLTLNSSAAVSHFKSNVNVFTPDYLTWDKMSQVEANTSGMTMIQSENILNYQTSIRNLHNFDAMVGFTYNYDFLNSLAGRAKGGPTNHIHYVGEGWPLSKKDEFGNFVALQNFLSNFEEQKMVSMLGRLSYNFDKRYLVDLSIRRDGSSVFGRNVRWGNFPSVGLGWVFSGEKFTKDWWWLSFGKLRASWGRSGQKFQEAYLAHGMMEESHVFFGTPGLIPAILGNDALTWEKSDQVDLGLDLDLFNYRIKASLDYYYKYSYALLMQVPMPGDVYFVDKMWNNSSAISNEGLEFSLKADVIRNDEFSWQTMFNISRNWNLFREAYGGVDLDDMVLGRPLYGLYVYKDEGYVQSESDIPYYYSPSGIRTPLLIGGKSQPIGVGARKIKDQNMDGKIDSNDLYYAGSTIPKAYGGFSNQFMWKGFKLFLHMNFSLGRKVINQVRGSALNFSKDFITIMEDYTSKTFWEKPGDVTDFPSLKYADAQYVGQFDSSTDSNIENVSFLRLKQATLSYDLPKKTVEKMNLSGVRFYLTGENLFMLTNYSGLDPEIIDPTTGRDDGSFYPLNRKVTLGLNINF